MPRLWVRFFTCVEIISYLYLSENSYFSGDRSPPFPPDPLHARGGLKPLGDRHQPPGEKQNDYNKRETKDDKMNLPQGESKKLIEGEKTDRAENRTEEGSQSPDKRGKGG